MSNILYIQNHRKLILYSKVILWNGHSQNVYDGLFDNLLKIDVSNFVMSGASKAIIMENQLLWYLEMFMFSISPFTNIV